MGRGSEAAALGAQLGLTDLETLGIAIEGAALLAQGRVDQGMRRLDQAAAVAAGEDFELPTLAWVGAVHHDRGLRTLGDFGAWLSGAKRCGRSAPPETSSPAGVSGPAAESELLAALADLEAHQARHGTRRSCATEAKLRARRGRTDEAQALAGGPVHTGPL
jgi:hypothetical protein